jgi:glycosyltransferase involved in cell wall biosynthesis
MNSNSNLISIVISTRGKPWEILSKTLDSIISSVFKGYEIVLVDQNNNDDIKKKISDSSVYEDIIYIPSNEKGLSRGRNKGLAHSNGNWIIFFDDDAILPNNTLQKIIKTLSEKKDEAWIHYGKVLTLETGKPYLKKAALMGKRINLLNFDSVCSISLIFNRRSIEITGGFDERLGAGAELGSGEETDMLLRAFAERIEIRSLNDFVVYHPAAEIVIDIQKRRSYGMGLGAVYRKHIFSSLYFLVALSLKLFSELMLRVALIIINSGSPLFRRYHSVYLAGFMKGFFMKKPNR